MFIYIVQKGDTFTSIAKAVNRAVGIDYPKIQVANNMNGSTALSVDQVLKIPANNSNEVAFLYTVQSGDDLWHIAEEYINGSKGVSAQNIATFNPTVNPETPKVGTRLTIPKASPDTATGTDTNTGNDTGTNSTEPAEYIGYWHRTWEKDDKAPANTNIGVAFSGHTDVDLALRDSDQVFNKLVGEKYISLGGVDAQRNGEFTSAKLTKIAEAIKGGRFNKYVGIVFDIEMGESNLANLFKEAFAATKAQKLRVLVTISHSTPYEIADGPVLMREFFKDSNIDFLSPQLYNNGDELKNDYTNVQVEWREFASSTAKIIPSIVKAHLYPDAKAHFATHKVTLSGYIQWDNA